MKRYFATLKFLSLFSILIFMGCSTIANLEDSHVLSISNGGSYMDFKALKQSNHRDCGEVCVISVLRYWGVNADKREVHNFLGDPEEGGYSLIQLKRFAEYKGLKAIILSGTLKELKYQCTLGRPCIIILKNRFFGNHSIVALGVTRGTGNDVQITIMDPSDGKIHTENAESILNRWREIGSPMLLIAKLSTANNK